MFLSFSKFIIVYTAGIETSRQLWNRVFPFFLNILVCRRNSDSETTLDGLTVSLVHVEVGRRACPSTHRSLLQLVQQCRLVRPEFFTEMHTVHLALNCCYRLFFDQRSSQKHALFASLTTSVTGGSYTRSSGPIVNKALGYFLALEHT